MSQPSPHLLSPKLRWKRRIGPTIEAHLEPFRLAGREQDSSDRNPTLSAADIDSFGIQEPITHRLESASNPGINTLLQLGGMDPRSRILSIEMEVFLPPGR